MESFARLKLVSETESNFGIYFYFYNFFFSSGKTRKHYPLPVILTQKQEKTHKVLPTQKDQETQLYVPPVQADVKITSFGSKVGTE